MNRYHVIAAKKDNLNNKDSFSKPCYLANLMKKNDNIIVKTILEEPLSDIFYISLDINKLPSIDKVIEFYTKYGIDEHKAEVIGYNYRLKTEMMQQFQKGLKVSRYTVKDWYKFKNTQSKEVLSIKETKKEEIDATDDFGEH